MTLSSLIGHVCEVLAEILDRPEVPADAVISRFFRDRRYLGSHDRGYIAETTYSVLRDVLRLHFLFRPELEGESVDRVAGVVLAAWLMSQSDEPSDRSSIFIGTGLGTGQLRAIEEVLQQADQQIETLSEPDRTAVQFSLPVWLVEKLSDQIESQDVPLLLASLNRQAPITLRTNTLRSTRSRLAGALGTHGVPSKNGVYSPDALLLEKRINANAVPGFKEGWFEIQDEGSQMLSVLLDPHPNWRVFDACAGAGGKSLHLAAIMKGRGEVVAHDVHSRRLREIRPRLKRSGAQNVRVMEHEDYLQKRESLQGTFDAMLIDAPCTGIGVLRRNPASRLTLDEAMLERVVGLQHAILQDYSGLVKPGGLLLYATCSLLREENELQVDQFLSDHPEFSLEPVQAPPEMLSSEGFFRSYPHRHGTDGFFGALMRRHAG